ncbi:MAG: dual CXXC motif small (seleno)protein [Desulfatirhabdiaceae bacterium]
MRCRFCGREYFLKEFQELMDDDLEELLMNVRCDRL